MTPKHKENKASDYQGKNELQVVNCILLQKHEDDHVLHAYRQTTHEQEPRFIEHQIWKDASCIKVHC